MLIQITAVDCVLLSQSEETQTNNTHRHSLPHKPTDSRGLWRLCTPFSLYA